MSASGYGNHFGFRVSSAEFRSGAEGRKYVPATGNFLQGQFVSVDEANPGKLKAAAANTAISPGYAGFLVQESAHIRGAFDSPVINQTTREKVKNDETAVITTGAGLKVWMKNDSDRTMYVATDVVVGSYLGWNGTAFINTTDATRRIARVIELDTTAQYLEAVLVA